MKPGALTPISVWQESLHQRLSCGSSGHSRDGCATKLRQPPQFLASRYVRSYNRVLSPSLLSRGSGSTPMSAATDSPATKPPVTGLWGGILTVTPVVLTVLATILAGLSNSEMTQAQYHRSLAAQYQSKVGDQWAFFQAKRIRGSSLETAADHLAPSSP